MDSDDEEMFATLMYEEADASGYDDDHLMIISCLFGLYARECKAVSWGYESGALKSKSMHRLEGYCMLYTDYFTDDPLHCEMLFQRHFKMNRKLFMKIIMSIKEFGI
jgi:hypothetical protein